MANLRIGDKIMPFDLMGVDDQQHSLSDFAEKSAIAIIFSCNHCPYVRAWEDRMVKIQRDYSEKNVQLIAINANDASKFPDDSFEKMKERAKEKQFNFPYLRDETQEIAVSYGATRTPEVFLFDNAGFLRYHGPIDDNYDDPNSVGIHYLRNALDAVISGRPVAITEISPVGCSVKLRQTP